MRREARRCVYWMLSAVIMRPTGDAGARRCGYALYERRTCRSEGRGRGRGEDMLIPTRVVVGRAIHIRADRARPRGMGEERRAMSCVVPPVAVVRGEPLRHALGRRRRQPPRRGPLYLAQQGVHVERHNYDWQR